jgi:hypothetical protein
MNVFNINLALQAFCPTQQSLHQILYRILPYIAKIDIAWLEETCLAMISVPGMDFLRKTIK